MARSSRYSKFQNVFGQHTLEKFNGLSIHNQHSEGSGLAVSFSHLAFPHGASGNVVCGIAMKSIGDRSPQLFLGKHHKGAIQDLQFSPLCENLLATCSNDMTVKIWKIPYDDTGDNPVNLVPLITFLGHHRKVVTCRFNPVVSSVLASGCYDQTIKIWDLQKQEAMLETKLYDVMYHLKWNRLGNLLAVSTKNKYINIFDPRVTKSITQIESHLGGKPTKVEWFGGSLVPEHYLFTTGFDKGANRVYQFWDTRNTAQPCLKGLLSKGTNSLFPYWDEDTGLLFLAARGDASVHVMEYMDGDFYNRSSCGSFSGCRGFDMGPKRLVNTSKCEIARCFIIESNETIQPLEFIVPREIKKFYADLYPPCFRGQPSLDSNEWFQGQVATQYYRASMEPLEDGTSPFAIRVYDGPNDSSCFNVASLKKRTFLEKRDSFGQEDKHNSSSTIEFSPSTSDDKDPLQNCALLITQLNEKIKTLEHKNFILTEKNKQLQKIFDLCEKTMKAVYSKGLKESNEMPYVEDRNL
ncbi:uncharacterized protein LOC128883050 isoform X2 [Hylaeus volcanicus]|uniref:uncharacterized protein LOC128883050 isoform X2 n=1 Tax=Hylaeus volcanicus TaxID=313075 RepID=UPI0023B82584|nr:uncharacterized protein LOC128883050 isoform X2 [Hylaeus volcanicus]